MNVEYALEDEIAFWQNLIDHQAENTPPEVVERMVQARALAERKLRLAQRDAPENALQEAAPRPNVECFKAQT